MRWFKHFSDARHNPKFHKIGKKLGEKGYARAFKLIEMVGQLGGSGEEFTPRIDLNDSHTDLSWIADELKIDLRSTKFTLALFAKVRFIDPEAYRQNVIYVPQMREYADEWTRKKQPHDSVATPESLRSNSPQSQSQSKSQITEVEGDDQSESDDGRNRDLPHIQPSFKGNSDLTDQNADRNKIQSEGLPRWMKTDPWTFLGIDRSRVPKKFLLDGDGEPNFEFRFKRWWDNYRLEHRETGEEGTPADFSEYALEKSEEEGVKYPPVLLKRKKELTAA